MGKRTDTEIIRDNGVLKGGEYGRLGLTDEMLRLLQKQSLKDLFTPQNTTVMKG